MLKGVQPACLRSDAALEVVFGRYHLEWMRVAFADRPTKKPGILNAVSPVSVIVQS